MIDKNTNIYKNCLGWKWLRAFMIQLRKFFTVGYSYFSEIMVANTAKIITDSLFLRRMERQKY